MNGNTVKLSQRSVIALLLAALMVTLVATPALAWFDEGDVNGQAAQPCRVILDDAGGHVVYCMKLLPQTRPVVAERPLLHPAIVRAEQMSVPEVQIAEAPGQ